MIKTKAISGFTLLELMITLAVAAILAMVAVPSFKSLIDNSRLTAYSNDLITSLNYARSEAISRNIDITITKVGGATKVWDGGWIIEDGATLIKQYEALKAGFTLRSGANFASDITFTSEGFISGLGNGSFVICNADGNTATARQLIINTLGRARVEKGGVASCP